MIYNPTKGPLRIDTDPIDNSLVFLPTDGKVLKVPLNTSNTTSIGYINSSYQNTAIGDINTIDSTSIHMIVGNLVVGSQIFDNQGMLGVVSSINGSNISIIYIGGGGSTLIPYTNSDGKLDIDNVNYLINF
jgi:hypothetical protein